MFPSELAVMSLIEDKSQIKTTLQKRSVAFFIYFYKMMKAYILSIWENIIVRDRKTFIYVSLLLLIIRRETERRKKENERLYPLRLKCLSKALNISHNQPQGNVYLINNSLEGSKRSNGFWIINGNLSQAKAQCISKPYKVAHPH